jgi:hypothetical protein
MGNGEKRHIFDSQHLNIFSSSDVAAMAAEVKASGLPKAGS